MESLTNPSFLGITQSRQYYTVVPLHISLTQGEILLLWFPQCQIIVQFSVTVQSIIYDLSIFTLFKRQFDSINARKISEGIFFFFFLAQHRKGYCYNHNLSLPFIEHRSFLLQINTDLNRFQPWKNKYNFTSDPWKFLVNIVSPWRATLIQRVKYKCEVYGKSISCVFMCQNILLSTTV